MAAQNHIRWLLGELPDWQAQGLLDPDSVSRLQDHYQSELKAPGPNPTFIITGVLGAVLIGAGIISIFAYNWDEFSRSFRTVLSVAPLLIAVGIYAYAFLKQRQSIAWAESTSAFLMLMIGSSIALISQTYNISGSTAEFLYTWMLLSIPLLYVRHSTLALLIFLTGVTTWTVGFAGYAGKAVGYWLWILIALPHVWRSIKLPVQEDIRANLTGWALAISLVVAMFAVPEWRVSEHILMAFASMFGLLYVAGRWLYNWGEQLWWRPFQTTALVGIYILSLILSFEWFQQPSSWQEITNGINYRPTATYINLGVGTLLLGLWAWGSLQHHKRGNWLNYFPVAFPLVMLTGILLARIGEGGYATTWFNLYLLAFGIFYLRTGIEKERLGLTNAGMLFIASLLLLRFFDANLSFLLKGVIFLVIGAAFLGVNYYLVKKKKESDEVESV